MNSTVSTAVPLLISQQTSDFDQLASGIPGWNTAFSQISKGPFRGQIELLNFDGFTICNIGANRQLLVRGEHRPDTFGFGFPDFSSNEVSYAGQKMKPGQVISLGPDECLDQTTCQDYQAFFVEVDSTIFLREMNCLVRREVDSHLENKKILSAAPAFSVEIASCLKRILDLMKRDSCLLTDPSIQRRLTHSLVSKLANLFIEPGSFDHSGTRIQHRRQLVLQAECFMDEHLAGDLTIIDLCRELEVSERTLHYAFRELVGQSPMAWYRMKRLNAVRRILRQSDPKHITVTQAAHTVGFFHPGQFAAAYQQLFGELPSRTLIK